MKRSYIVRISCFQWFRLGIDESVSVVKTLSFLKNANRSPFASLKIAEFVRVVRNVIQYPHTLMKLTAVTKR